MRELIRAAGQGYEAWILFVIQMKGVSGMAPNWRTHREFGEALKEAKEKAFTYGPWTAWYPGRGCGSTGKSLWSFYPAARTGRGISHAGHRIRRKFLSD